MGAGCFNIFAAMKILIGIVAATKMEIAPLLSKKNNKQIAFCISGIGGVNTTYQLIDFINQYQPTILIQAGIAGSFNKEINPGTVVLIQKDRFADLGVVENDKWKDIFELGLSDPSSPPFANGWLINPRGLQYNPNKLKNVTGISVNEINTSATKTRILTDKYQPVTESMEGAAFHYVCLQKNIPFIQIRAVSNYVGERNKANWEIEKSVLCLNKELEEIIDLILNENKK